MSKGIRKANGTSWKKALSINPFLFENGGFVIMQDVFFDKSYGKSQERKLSFVPYFRSDVDTRYFSDKTSEIFPEPEAHSQTEITFFGMNGISNFDA